MSLDTHTHTELKHTPLKHTRKANFSEMVSRNTEQKNHLFTTH